MIKVRVAFFARMVHVKVSVRFGFADLERFQICAFAFYAVTPAIAFHEVERHHLLFISKLKIIIS